MKGKGWRKLGELKHTEKEREVNEDSLGMSKRVCFSLPKAHETIKIVKMLENSQMRLNDQSQLRLNDQSQMRLNDQHD